MGSSYVPYFFPAVPHLDAVSEEREQTRIDSYTRTDSPRSNFRTPFAAAHRLLISTLQPDPSLVRTQKRLNKARYKPRTTLSFSFLYSYRHTFEKLFATDR